MRVDFQGRNAEITKRFREHCQPRVAALQNHFDRIHDVRVTVSAQRNWRTVEITLEADGLLLRSEERSNDDLASFDRALDRLERQLVRYRERVKHHARRSTRGKAEGEAEGEAEELTQQPAEQVPVALAELDTNRIEFIRTKSHALKPMTPEEAALQMDLLGHDFFMFFDDDSEQVEVVYRRRDGGYGLIEPVIG